MTERLTTAPMLWLPLSRARLTDRSRGAGMLEYVLIALVSIAIFTALYNIFPGFFENLVDTITSQIGDVVN